MPALRRAKPFLRALLALGMVAIGVLHFVDPASFMKIVPAFLPAPRALVLVSGAFEILGGVGLLVPRTRRAASLGLVALYVAVFPANVNMAIHDISLGDGPVSPYFLWGRLPFQALFIAWAYWAGKPDEARSDKPV